MLDVGYCSWLARGDHGMDEISPRLVWGLLLLWRAWFYIPIRGADTEKWSYYCHFTDETLVTSPWVPHRLSYLCCLLNALSELMRLVACTSYG